MAFVVACTDNLRRGMAASQSCSSATHFKYQRPTIYTTALLFSMVGSDTQGVCQEWRCISETTAVRKFQKKWCLDDVSGRPRNFGSLVVSAVHEQDYQDVLSGRVQGLRNAADSTWDDDAPTTMKFAILLCIFQRSLR